MKSPNQILAEKLANRELEIADLLVANERLELRLKEVSDEVATLRQCPAQPVAMRRIHDEGDEANGAALWH
jgi:predicted metalloprotease